MAQLPKLRLIVTDATRTDTHHNNSAEKDKPQTSHRSLRATWAPIPALMPPGVTLPSVAFMARTHVSLAVVLI